MPESTVIPAIIDAAQQVPIQGIDYSPARDEYFNQQVDYRLQRGPSGFGAPITLRAAQKMLEVRHGDLSNPKSPDSMAFIDFGRESILLLLAQSGCEGIRFYYCENHNATESLIAIGFDNAGNDLGYGDISTPQLATALRDNEPTESLIVEIGSGRKISEILAKRSKAITQPSPKLPVSDNESDNSDEHTKEEIAAFNDSSFPKLSDTLKDDMPNLQEDTLHTPGLLNLLSLTS